MPPYIVDTCMHTWAWVLYSIPAVYSILCSIYYTPDVELCVHTKHFLTFELFVHRSTDTRLYNHTRMVQKNILYAYGTYHTRMVCIIRVWYKILVRYTTARPLFLRRAFIACSISARAEKRVLILQAINALHENSGLATRD